MSEDTLRLQGKVDSVVYRNDENGYTVLRLLAEGLDEPATVVGCMPGVSVGETLTVTGAWSHHATYGAQFKVKTMERALPKGADAILEYLSSGAIKGIGPATARVLVEAFGDKTLEVLEEHPQHLRAIKGFSPKRAKEVGQAFKEQMGMRRLLDFLRRHGLSADLALPLYRLYGLDALDRVKDDPYLLTRPGLDVVFQSADALAVELGVDATDPQRLEAALLFELRHNAGG